MSTALKFSIQPGLDDHPGQLLTNNTGPKSQDICVVMLTREHGGIRFAAYDCPDALDFVSSDGHAYARTADQDAQVSLVCRDCRGNFSREQWIICTCC